jgi:hypothetical protein
MKRILLIVLLGLVLSGCATLSSTYNRVKDCVYPQAKPPAVVETPITTPPAPPAEPTIKVPEPSETKEEVIPPKKVRKLKLDKKVKTKAGPTKSIETEDLQKVPATTPTITK